MLVNELIAKLKSYPQGHEIVVKLKEEGEGFDGGSIFTSNPIVDVCGYLPDNNEVGIYLNEL